MLEAKDIHKIYDDGKRELPVLKGIDLNIEKGAFVSIVGPSGAGKSTLLHILGGLDSPTKGEVALEGEVLYSLSDAALAKIRNEKIGFCFQFYHLLPEFTVLENVTMPALIKSQVTSHKPGGSGLPSDRQSHSPQLKEKAAKLLEQVGLRDRMAHFPSQLSGGEKQRVALARALTNSPALLLCDEPTGNLDSEAGEGIISLIKKLNLENKMTVVLVTHNLELAKIAQRTYYLRDGVLTG